jgi:hypothetical protein
VAGLASGQHRKEAYIGFPRLSNKEGPIQQTIALFTGCLGQQATAMAGGEITVFGTLAVALYAHRIGRTPGGLLNRTQNDVLEKSLTCLADKPPHGPF